jgi:formylglycine-generating enzyme required for sulfatase activity
VLRRVGLVLPTDAQWEYACGAGASTLWFFGNDPDDLPAFDNVDDQRYLLGCTGVIVARAFDDGFCRVAPVGRYLPNPFGLHDLYGNVSEWCRDTGVPLSESVPLPGDGLRGPARSDGLRVYHGGSFANSNGKTSSRLGMPEDARNYAVGLRPARPLQKARR